MSQIVIPHCDRYPQDEIRRHLETHRFGVLVCHRRMGKTVLGLTHIIKRAVQNLRPNPSYHYIAPFRNQARDVSWDYLLRFTQPFPDRRINEQRMEVMFLGRKIQVLGADNPDALRGRYSDGVILDEYAQMKPTVFTEVVRPMITDRGGWVLFSGTPKGQNHFFTQYNFARRELAANPGGDWWAGLYRADQTGVISTEELARIQTETPANIFRQEYLCDFTASRDDVLIPIDRVLEAQKRLYGEYELRGAPKVLGVDPARFGDDRSVIVRRHGLQAYPPRVLAKVDNVQLAGTVAEEIRDFRPDAVFIDAGYGAGVIDILRSMGHEVVEVPFGGAPIKAGRYRNKRAELWGEMAEWINSGGALPAQETELAGEISSAVYDFDGAGKMRLEPKEKIKERVGKSPDLADALALTFAAPVLGSAAGRAAGLQQSYNLEFTL